jgi:peptidyl-dipeptidase A
VLAESRDPAVLLDAWRGWHAVGAPMRARYARFVDLSNEGARELGFRDAGALWRAGYDMPPETFPAEVERLWQQVRPLYTSLHAYVRTRLNQRYGDAAVPKGGMIPAHLLGNMWAQEWGNVYPLVAPPNAAPTYDLTALLKAKGVDQRGMVKYGEGFFTSLGFAPLPGHVLGAVADRQAARPRRGVPRERVGRRQQDDVRIKMCTEVTGEDFVTVHHELGHNFYQRAYNRQPYLFQTARTTASTRRSATRSRWRSRPATCSRPGLLGARRARRPTPRPSSARRSTRSRSCRSGCSSTSGGGRCSAARSARPTTTARGGRCAPGTRASPRRSPAPRPTSTREPSSTCRATRPTRATSSPACCSSSSTGRCAARRGTPGRSTAARSSAARRRARGSPGCSRPGQSRPWQETLFAMTGERRMDAGAMLEYFAPLQAWLDRQNEGRPVGWPASARTAAAPAPR